jgi:tetratricopeptide (TPR) repeat protein
VSQLIERGGPATQSHSLSARAHILGGRFNDAKAELEQQIRIRESDGTAVEAMFRYWLGQLAALRGDTTVASRQAELLHQRPATPPGLHAFRMAAELAWLADRRDLLAQIAEQMRTLERVHSSTRSKGFRLFVEALELSARSRAAEAVDHMANSLEFWPDVTGRWMSAELMVEAKMYPQALDQFRKVVDAQRSALGFFAVTNWVRSLGRAAWCLEKTGQADSAAYRARFEQLWGASERYRLARHA